MDLLAENRPFSPPSSEHWLGTDALGQSYLGVLIKSTTLTIVDVTLAASLALLLGLLIGSLGATLSRNTGRFMFRVATTFSFATPLIAVLLLLYSIVGDAAFVFPLAAGALLWGTSALTFQTAISNEWRADYMNTARSLGMTPTRLIFHQLLPNLIPPVRAAWTANWPIMLSVSVLTGYLGAHGGSPRLGSLLKSGYEIFPSGPWLWLPPTVVTSLMFAILFLVISPKDVFSRTRSNVRQ